MREDMVMNLNNIKKTWTAGRTVCALGSLCGICALVSYFVSFEINGLCAACLAVGCIANVFTIILGKKLVEYISYICYLASLSIVAIGSVKTVVDVIAAIDVSGFETGFLVTVISLVLAVVFSFAASIMPLNHELISVVVEE